MATETTASVIPMAAQLRPRSRSISRALAGYCALTKPDINFLIAIAVFVGFCMARSSTWQKFPIALLVHTLLGSLLVASGSGVLNQVIERKHDARMRRTSRRPLVVGTVAPLPAMWFGVSLAVGGAVYLAFAVNWLSSLIAVLTIVFYLAIYTPLKRKTPMCTFVGALPGAAPPLIGWAAASGGLSSGAWTLFLILFLWQFPHFMAIAWMYREDYDRAGYMVLPRCKKRWGFTCLQTLLPAFLLVPICLIPALEGETGRVALVGTILLGVMFLFYAVRLAFNRSNIVARQLLLASIVYLPSVLLLILLDRT
jgi:protoheme IX farnesyltransferase